MSPAPFAVTDRTAFHRVPARGSYDRAVAYSILDEGLVCHVGIAPGGQPFVIPTTYARDGDRIVIHGSPASRLIRSLKGGVDVCVTVTLLDGLVLARSAFHHSMNYRSVVVLGRADPVLDPEAKRRALDLIVEHVVPGRTGDTRPPSEHELRSTLVLSLPLEEASVKVRTGPPIDDEADLGSSAWGGVIPLTLVPGPPEADELVPTGIGAPTYALDYRRPPAVTSPTPSR